MFRNQLRQPQILHVWNISLHWGHFVRVNVAKYTSTISTMVRIWDHHGARVLQDLGQPHHDLTIDHG